MKNYSDRVAVTLAQSSLGAIQRCPSGGYHVNLQQVTLHLSADGFEGLVDLIRRAKEWEIQEFSFLS